MTRPTDLKYTPTHEWLRVEGKVATVGITDFAVEQLSDLVFIDLPKVGVQVTKDSRFGEIESTKTVSDLISPVSGKIVAVNDELTEHVDLISQGPFGKGWMLKIEMTKPTEAGELLSAADYQKQLDAEDH